MFLTFWCEVLSLVRFAGIVPASVPGVVRVIVPRQGRLPDGWFIWVSGISAAAFGQTGQDFLLEGYSVNQIKARVNIRVNAYTRIGNFGPVVPAACPVYWRRKIVCGKKILSAEWCAR